MKRFLSAVAARLLETRSTLLVLLVCAAWLAMLAGARSLMLPDEGRYIGVAWAMLRSGDWLTPTLDGLPYFHKPRFGEMRRQTDDAPGRLGQAQPAAGVVDHFHRLALGVQETHRTEQAAGKGEAEQRSRQFKASRRTGRRPGAAIRSRYPASRSAAARAPEKPG